MIPPNEPASLLWFRPFGRAETRYHGGAPRDNYRCLREAMGDKSAVSSDNRRASKN